MEMSVHLIADILFVLLGALIIWRCASNGFVKCLFKFVRTVLSIVLAYLLVSPVAPIIAEKFIHDPVYDYVYDKINGIYMEAEESLETSNIVEQFPDFLITEELEDKLENMDEAGEELVLSVSEEITAPIVKIVSSVIAFVLLFILIFILQEPILEQPIKCFSQECRGEKLCKEQKQFCFWIPLRCRLRNTN